MDINEDERRLCAQLRDRINDLKITDSFRVKDYNMIRFLKARNMDLEKAEEMFRKYIEWREENDMDNIMNWTVPRDLEQNFKYRVTGLSLDGGLVICLNVADWDPVITNGRLDELIKFAYHEIERLTLYAKYFTLQNDKYSRMVGLLNLEGLTFAHCSTVEWLRALITLLKVFESCYPETLTVAFLINDLKQFDVVSSFSATKAPWVFHILWSITKPFISNATHQRLRFLGADREVWKQEISAYVTEDQFPVSFGGQLPDDYELVLENDIVVGRRVPASNDDQTDNANDNDSPKPVDSIELD